MEKPWLAWRLARTLWRKQILRPMVRSPHPPEYQARASFWGLVVNFTPSIGFQLPMILGIWLLVRRLNREWDFNFPLAFAWTLITNPATAAPLYYLFYVTGRFMLGQGEATDMDLALFSQIFAGIFQAGDGDSDWWSLLVRQMRALWRDFGIPLIVGSLPWAFGCGWLGHVWTKRFVLAYRAHRLARQKSAQKPAPARPDGAGESGRALRE